nr:ABC transporter B family member 1 [Ipomoea batatas]
MFLKGNTEEEAGRRLVEMGEKPSSPPLLLGLGAFQICRSDLDYVLMGIGELGAIVQMALHSPFGKPFTTWQTFVSVCVFGFTQFVQLLELLLWFLLIAVIGASHIDISQAFWEEAKRRFQKAETLWNRQWFKSRQYCLCGETKKSITKPISAALKLPRNLLPRVAFLKAGDWEHIFSHCFLLLCPFLLGMEAYLVRHHTQMRTWHWPQCSLVISVAHSVTGQLELKNGNSATLRGQIFKFFNNFSLLVLWEDNCLWLEVVFWEKQHVSPLLKVLGSPTSEARIAIARAMLKTLQSFCWMKATSALDSESEKLVQAGTRDRAVYSEIGTHDELISQRENIGVCQTYEMQEAAHETAMNNARKEQCQLAPLALSSAGSLSAILCQCP